MRDWDEGDVRDRLPLLLHGALPPAEAAAVRARAADDLALAEELALLGALREAHAEGPAIDVGRIVAALPAPGRARPRGVSASALRVTRWAQAAALAAVLSVGGFASWVAGTSPRGPVAPGAGTPAPIAQELGLGAPLDELSLEQLEALEAEIRSLDGLPAESPEAGAAHGGLEIGA